MMFFHYAIPVGGAPIADVKGLRDYALVLLGMTSARCLEDIAALRWSDLYIHDASVTIHWRRVHGQPRDEPLPNDVSAALLRYLHALHGTALAAVRPDTPLWVGLRRIGDQMMLSTRAIVAIYREYMQRMQSNAPPSPLAAAPTERIKRRTLRLHARTMLQDQLPNTSADQSGASIHAMAAAALTVALQAPEQALAAIAPCDIAVLRDELMRRKERESKSATIRDLWRVQGGKRFLAASRLYGLLLQDDL